MTIYFIAGCARRVWAGALFSLDFLAHEALHASQQHITRQGGFAGARDAGDRHQMLQWHGGFHVLQVVQVGAFQCEPAGGGIDRPARMQRVPHGVAQVAAGGGIGGGFEIGRGALGHQPAAAHAGAGADVDQVLGAADGVFVVLHHHQRVALAGERVQRVQQDAVVARVQADGGLVQHVAHALQVAAQLRRQADALRLAAAERGRAAVQREVAQAHLLQKLQPAPDFRQQVACDVGVAALQLKAFEPVAQLAHAHARQPGDGDALRGAALQQHGTRDRVQPRALAGGAGSVAHVLHLGFGEGLLAPLLVGGQHRIVQRLALLFGEPDTGAHAIRAPAVLAVVGEQARVELGVAGGADRAGALGGEHLHPADARRGRAGFHGRVQAGQVAQHVHHALAVLQRTRQRFAQLHLVAGRDGQAHHRQLDGMFLEAVDAREARGGQKLAVHPQVGEAARARPVGQLGVDALAAHHQRRQEADGLAAVALQELRGDALGRLRQHRRAVVHAVLHAELDVQQAQEVPDLGGGAHRALAAAAREALLDRHRGRDAVHRVHLRPAGRLHDAAGVGVEAFQVAALPFVEQDVEGQRALARAADAGDHVELAARDVDAEVLQVVFARVHDFNGISGLWPLCGGRRQLLFVEQLRLLRGVAGLAQRLRVGAQRGPGVRGGVARHLIRRAFGHDLAAGVATLGAQVDQPVGGAHDVEVVLDHHQRMPGVQQLAEGAHQLGDVVEVQASGGLIEQEQRALARGRLTAGSGVLRGIGQEAGELEALRLAARQRGHGLAELDVIQPHIDDGLQRADHLAVVREQLRRLGHGEVQHVGHVHVARAQLAHGVALDLHFQDLGAVALAVAIRAAQVDVGEELHLDVLEARAAAGGAAPVARVEAELGRRVAALARQRRGGEQRADRVPGAHVADRVGARGLADGRLVHEDHAAQVVGAQQALVRAGRFGGLAEVAHQRRRQHVLDQRGLAGAGHARHHHQPLQRELHRHVLQVVLGGAFQDQARRALAHGAREAGADVLAPAQVGAGERVGAAQFIGRAVEHDLAAGGAGAGAEVEHTVGGQHHGRVVFHHHQRVAGALEALHGFGDAVHVARVQADAGLVQHEQRVDQRGAERRGEVDALHLTAAERAALAIQREVADAHIAQVADAGGDFVQDQLARLGVGGFGIEYGSSPCFIAAGSYAFRSIVRRQPVEESAQPVDRQQHQVV